MKIEYELVRNHLTETEDFRAVVHHSGIAGMDDVVERIVRQGSTVTRADIFSVLEDFFLAIEYLLLEGARINTPLVNFGLSIRGVFRHCHEQFDAARHELRVTFGIGRRLRKTIRRRGKVTRKPGRVPFPTLYFYLDACTGEYDGPLTPGGLGKVGGEWLKFDPADEAQGLFFVDEEERETRVAVVGTNRPKELVFQTPYDLAPGGYRLEVRAIVGRKGNKVRTGRLSSVLEVAEVEPGAAEVEPEVVEAEPAPPTSPGGGAVDADGMVPE